jgi:hypothetical protein
MFCMSPSDVIQKYFTQIYDFWMQAVNGEISLLENKMIFVDEERQQKIKKRGFELLEGEKEELYKILE